MFLNILGMNIESIKNKPSEPSVVGILRPWETLPHLPPLLATFQLQQKVAYELVVLSVRMLVSYAYFSNTTSSSTNSI